MTYWEQRYRAGGSSGAGSAGMEAHEKANIVNLFIRSNKVTSVLDMGCGDGVVASMLRVPEYLGYDPSDTAIEMCKKAMPERSFTCTLPLGGRVYGMVLSMDVIFHLVRDDDYYSYLRSMFRLADNHILVYGTNHEKRGASHVRHREWTLDIPCNWSMSSVLNTKFKTAWMLERGV